jgi:hypothetical protein
MSRILNNGLRALYMPGLVARRHNPLLKVFADRLLANGFAKKAVIGAVMRKLIQLVYDVLKSGKPFDPKFSIKSCNSRRYDPQSFAKAQIKRLTVNVEHPLHRYVYLRALPMDSIPPASFV